MELYDPSNCEEIFPSVEQQRISRDKLLSEISIWKAEGLGAMTGGQGGERSLLDKLSDICDVAGFCSSLRNFSPPLTFFLKTFYIGK